MLNRELGLYTIVAPLGAGGPASARMNALASSGEVSPQPSQGDAMNSGDEVGPYRVLGKLGEGAFTWGGATLDDLRPGLSVSPAGEVLVSSLNLAALNVDLMLIENFR
jgi:hypothetical protein